MESTGARFSQLIAKRCIIAFHDGAALLLIAAILSFAVIEPAYAYVDPSVMTYTIQALAGVAVALGAVAGVAFRRSRKALFRLLNIDENAGKAVEQDVHRIEANDEQGRTAADEQARGLSSRDGNGHPRRLSWKRRIIFALIASGFFTFTLFIAAPYEIIGGGSASLLFGLSETWKPIALAGATVWIVLALLASLLRGKAFDIAVVALTGLGLLCYLQALFGNGQLPSADGAGVDWSSYLAVTIINGILWLAGIAVIALLFWKKPMMCRNGLCILAVCITIVEAVGVGSLFLDPNVMGKTAHDSSSYVTEEGLYDVSDKSNVILFLLDWYDNALLENLLDANPGMLDEMTGFTRYRDVSGTIAPTRYAVPWMLTAEFIQHDETSSHYFSTLYDRSTFLDDLEATGYSLGIYTDTFGATNEEAATGLEYTAQRAFNIHPIDSVNLLSLNEFSTVLVMYKASCYRNLPWALKPPFWFYTDQINQAMVQRERPDDSLADTLYVMDDAHYYDKLQQTGLSINDDEIGSFRLIHLMGIHEPYTLDENGERVSGNEGSTIEQQGQGVMKIVAEYIRQLKELGVYDKTAIIISCDHGTYRWEDDPLQTPNSPIMLVKLAGAGGQEGEIGSSDAPISQFDLHATIMKAMTGDGSKYGTAFEDVDANAPRTRMYVHPTNELANEAEFIEYEIDGYALDFNNWHTTGTVWE